MAEEGHGKWVGKASAEISGVKPDQIWPFIADFCNIHKWSSFLDSCSLEEGTVGEVGAVRFCTTKALPAVDGGAEGTGYVKEKLVELDTTARSLSYMVLENNVGLPSGGYVATAKVSEGAGGCVIEWSFVSEPIEGWKLEDLRSSLEANLKFMADRMEAAAKATAA